MGEVVVAPIGVAAAKAAVTSLCMSQLRWEAYKGRDFIFWGCKWESGKCFMTLLTIAAIKDLVGIWGDHLAN